MHQGCKGINRATDFYKIKRGSSCFAPLYYWETLLVFVDIIVGVSMPASVGFFKCRLGKEDGGVVGIIRVHEELILWAIYSSEI